MEDGERAVGAPLEKLAATPPSVDEDALMEDAGAAIAVAENALSAEILDDKEMDDEVASVASDGTVDLEQMEEDVEDVPEEEIKKTDMGITAEAELAVETSVTAEETALTVSLEPPTATSTDAAMNDTKSASGGSSSSSSSDSSSSDSSSSDSSSDSEVEDVTDQYKPVVVDPDAPRLRTMSESGDDEVDAEQWFDGPTLESDGVEVVGVVEAPLQGVGGQDNDDDEEEEDVFLTPFKPELERGSATKRRRPEDEENDAMEGVESAGEETTSSEPEPLSEDEFGRRRKSTIRKKTKKALGSHTNQRPKKPTRTVKVLHAVAAPVEYTHVPTKYDIFNGVPNDDSNFPFLKGDYQIRGGHRAFFTGMWGFTEADFQGGVVSKFEYTSGYIHDRAHGDRQPFSGTYGGYFNLRQFSGKVTKIKEDHIQLWFVRFRGDDKTKQAAMDDEKENSAITQYEVFGEGKNRYGPFLVRGYFNAETGGMIVRRRYLE